MPIWGCEHPPLPLAYVSSIIKSAAWECDIVDFNIELYSLASEHDKPEWDNPIFFLHDDMFLSDFFEKFRVHIEQHLSALISHAHYDLIGFSVTNQARFFSLRTAEILASLIPDTPIVFGGTDCFPLEYGKRFLLEHDFHPHLIFQGEAEISFPEFLREFQTTRDYRTTIPGFSYKDNGQVIYTGDPELPNLKTQNIVADFSTFRFEQYRELTIPSFISRGCINKCAFCNERLHFKRFRTRNIRTVIHEIQAAVQTVPQKEETLHVYFSDSIFNGNPKHVEQLCDGLIASGIQINWTASVSFSAKIKEQILEKMHLSGCVKLFWGLESASPNVLKLMGKNFSVDRVKQVLAAAIELRIENHLAIIVGFPGELPEDVLLTALFILEYKKKPCITFQYVTPIVIKPNSLLHTNYQDYDLSSNDHDNWISTDRRNDRAVRIFRFLFINNLLYNDELSLEQSNQLDPYRLWEYLDFNSPALASDVVAIFYLLALNSHQEEKTRLFFEQWATQNTAAANSVLPGQSFAQQELEYWYPQGVPRGIQLAGWFTSDKNSVESKQKIVRFLLELIKDNSRLQ
ncbi:B12-binding domain-containing radical SAM protein [candidate division CSSED10-310 bacterium]|uniref:B12-binding domain-containing radical SAM protein n=1 Tax=candidate division CSSED10-310 bacterium TaxID=2855610 RepID=A0ABV6YX41_UNCC1